MSETYRDWDNRTDWANPNQSPQPATQVVPISASNEVNFEDATMRERLFAWLSNKVTEASDLNKRVADLEKQVNDMEAQLQGLAHELADERAAHADTKRNLQSVQGQLDREQHAVADLVNERDIVVAERNRVTEERDAALRSAHDWEIQHRAAVQERDHERQRADIAEERANQMAEQIANLKRAFSALQAA